MKCVGAEEGQPCQRCKRSGTECIFEKHRRGRKPGSKLSEASKMLRRLEKGLNSAKLKSQTTDPGALTYPSETRPSDRFPNNELPPLNLPPDYEGGPVPSSSRAGREEEGEESEKAEGKNIFPQELISQEQRNSKFFKTILNPEPYEPPPSRPTSERSQTVDETRPRSPHVPRVTSPPMSALAGLQTLQDPIAAGIIDERRAEILFDLFFLRLNPFINLFEPSLHTVNYVRSRCPFLFTTIIMACCKFFAEELYKHVRQLANEFAVKAFAEQWKRVEICQAFACLTYWREPDDNRTWTYIGYACRMAVELGLNRYVEKRPPEETDRQFLERRNRERTYLVLFVHDRSLSTQTGRQWMLPECELVRHSTTWHEEGGTPIRPEDVIVAAFVQLRRIASETTEVFASSRGAQGQHTDMNYDVLLRNCNGKLTQWGETWQREMQRANGEKFHFAFLSFFRLYVRLFLNSFGINGPLSSNTRATPSLAALSACYTSALESLQIVTKDFAGMAMLRYGQESTTVMTAYAAVFLLKLLRSSETLAQLHEGATEEIYSTIAKTADAYHEASTLSSSSSSAAYHARFLRALIANDTLRAKQAEKERYQQQQHQQQQSVRASESRYSSSSYSSGPSPSSGYQQHAMHVDHHSYSSHYPTSPSAPPPPPAMSSSHSHGHQHARDLEYPTAQDSSVRSSISGYPYTSSSSQHTLPPPPVAAPLAQAPPAHASAYSSPPQQPAYVATESDATYYRTMLREIGFGEGAEGGAYLAMGGFALTMPDGGGAFGAPHSAGGGAGGVAYHEPPSHSGYTHTNPSRHHYHPYPPPPYSSSHSGYSSLVSR